MKKLLWLVLALTTFTPILKAQRFGLDLNIELTGAKFDPNKDFERKINTNFRNDDPFNPIRAKIFPHIEITKTFGIEGDFLFDTKAKKFGSSEDRPLRIDGFFLSIHGLLDNRLNFWLGKIPTPVGTFSPRSYSHLNPLIGFPLAYQYKVPYDAFTLSNERSNLALRDLLVGAALSIYEACWITGISAFGNWEGVEYMVAVGQGTLTNPEAKENGGVQIAGRLGWTFSESFSAGVSAGVAPYLQHDTGLPSGTGVRDPKHVIFGADAKAKLNDLTLFFEAFYNSWDTPQYQVEKSISAITAYIEGQYFFRSNLYVAARYDRFFYGDITNPANNQKTPWGYNITRVEAGVGFLPLPELRLKAVIQNNALDHPTTKNISILALQAMVRLEDVQKVVGLPPFKKPY